MPAKPDLSAQVETMLSTERSNRRSWYRRASPPLPRWFAEAPDGLDPAQKQKLFDKAATDVKRGFAVGAIIFAAPLSMAVTGLVRHHMNAAAAALLLAFGVYCVCVPLFRRRLIDRHLRHQLQLS